MDEYIKSNPVGYRDTIATLYMAKTVESAKSIIGFSLEFTVTARRRLPSVERTAWSRCRFLPLETLRIERICASTRLLSISNRRIFWQKLPRSFCSVSFFLDYKISTFVITGEKRISYRYSKRSWIRECESNGKKIDEIRLGWEQRRTKWIFVGDFIHLIRISLLSQVYCL